ncbi:ATP-binding protein [Leptospira sp. GIMC2001]|uniref:ATP-binding protein n=1 Tax=Leptospira sp. GIMC2001 TaxID=1513297 RepID=UPI00234B5835|nr:ATP-binding protein [Leptospira sp. GIMC2001]WCL48366.1 ATP-binding protein [Leptospira sp. GIMC2001]
MKEFKNSKKPNYANTIRLQIPSHPKYLSLSRSFVFNAARDNGFSLYDSADIRLIVGEAVQNIIKHAYLENYDRPIFIDMEFFKEKVEIRIRDYGVKSKLASMKSYDLSDYREEGLGLYLIRKLTDHYFLDQSMEVGNQMVLMKKK